MSGIFLYLFSEKTPYFKKYDVSFHIQDFKIYPKIVVTYSASELPRILANLSWKKNFKKTCGKNQNTCSLSYYLFIGGLFDFPVYVRERKREHPPETYSRREERKNEYGRTFGEQQKISQ